MWSESSELVLSILKKKIVYCRERLQVLAWTEIAVVWKRGNWTPVKQRLSTRVSFVAGSDRMQCLCIQSGIILNEGVKLNSSLNRGSRGSYTCEGNGE